MTKVKAYAAQSSKSQLTPFTFDRRALGSHDVTIAIKYCGICHSDIHQARDEWGKGIFPMVPGHEIAGIVTNVGDKVTKFNIGDHVGVGCMVDSCRQCECCEQDLQQFCREGMVGTYNSYERDGKTPTYGGYSEAIVVDENFVLHIPDNLPLDKAAPLLCAGITLYSPLMHWKAGPGKKVAIVGLGGLGHMGVKIAHALGADVTVLSHTDKKQQDAKRLGADHFYSTSNAEIFDKLHNTFDLIINTVSSGIDLNQYLKLLKVDGSMVMVGISPSATEIAAFCKRSGAHTF
jgi:uncharacterized zinc-type alcohol dehydrogenase-like protein